jgi:tetratricopeptide (TPR) repeat protein
LRGHLATGQEKAEEGRQYFSKRDPQWGLRFQLLEAEILILRGLSSEALALLTPTLPTSAGDDLAIRQHMLLGLAQARLGRMDEGDRHFADAERLCDISHSSLAGEVARYRGAVEVQRADLDQADKLFRKSLQIARQLGDQFLETTALLNLGVVALKREHFDESIDWSTAAQKSSHAMNFGLNEEKVLGNLGWAYYKMGDFERALTLFEDATSRSRELGAVIDEIEWLNNQGLVYHDLGRLSEAEEYYNQSLGLAAKIKNPEQMSDALTALAFVSAERGESGVAPPTPKER